MPKRAAKMKGGQTSDELIDKYATTVSSLIGPDFQAAAAPSQEAYQRYANATTRRGQTPMTFADWSAFQQRRESSRKLDYETGQAAKIAEIPGLIQGWEKLEADPLVSCPYDAQGNTVKTTMTQSQCEAARAEWERKTHPENYYFFRPVVKGLTQVGDIAADVIGNLPAPGVAQLAAEAYKTFAPPGSKFYGQGHAHKINRLGKKLQGHGIFHNFLERAKRTGTAIIQRFTDVTKGIRRNYSPSVRNLLAEVGNRPVVSMVVRRDPIKSFLHTALNLITLGKWNTFRQRYNYDKLFHLGVEVAIRLSDSNDTIGRYVIEKNEVISIAPAKAYDKDTETVPVPLAGATTINQLLEKTEQRMGADYFPYDAFKNNCQDFILNLLLANGLATDALQAFVKQDVDQALSELPGYTGRVARAVTDIAALGSVALEGQGKKQFLKELHAADVDPVDYLEMAKRVATKAGYLAQQLQWSDKAGKKLMMTKPDGGVVHFGATGHGDFLLYSLSGDQELADRKRRSYLSRATRIRGDWRSDKYSPNNLAIRILWAMVNPK